ncbi:multicopper oxidase-domain-containing protein [Lasiosphaeria miniovina]|uniref:laccase n=1 Tax=Lasiosphaeria miniovina TaxID=1954250 RepID=A0AA40ABP3_9PEZI|nr:multicopper oxidase-domain-containing protein [Lasiosphaeria miniovina]KAK0712901.1 multicopper oxidase-domain-containing protein [Lasiosphaeria miniovina]
MAITVNSLLSCSLVWGLIQSCYALVTHSSPQELDLQPRQATCNTATNRQCWTSTFNINTDYETSWPNTGVTRTYTLTLTEIDNWVAGDGSTKVKAMLVNGQFPGPTLTANWGDQINITVVNNLRTNGTSIHYHGIRQLNTNTQDGSSGITECPVPPGASRKYSFIATQYGTAWYHSHYSAQYGNGVVGPIVISGPASSNYDIDLGSLMVTDWYNGAVNQIAARVNNPNNPYIPGFPGSPPNSDNVLFNGKNRNPATGGGSYAKFTLTPGSKHLVRLINPSVHNSFTLTLVGHSFTIVATDLVPVQPVTVTSLYIGIGQRYDVIIAANQPVANYWFNASFSAGPCGISNNPRPAAIFSYSGAPNANPTAAGTVPPDSLCADKLTYVPVVTRTAPASSYTPATGNTLNTNIQINNALVRVFWPVNNSPMSVSWNDPTLEYVKNGNTGAMPAARNVVSVPSANVWAFFLIQNNSSIPHPVHLHGHDILIAGASPPLANPINPANRLRAYNPATDGPNLKGNNPTRRDTTMLPAWGWLVVAFRTNNPGAWLFHCHIAWHVSQGFSVQFLEQLTAIPTTMSLNDITPNCAAWDAYYPANDPFTQDDSGI